MFPCTWTNVDAQIMLEYLKWFDAQMTGRKVILLMDNFDAAVEYLELLSNRIGPKKKFDR